MERSSRRSRTSSRSSSRRSSSRTSSLLPKRTPASGFDTNSPGHVSNIGSKNQLPKRKNAVGKHQQGTWNIICNAFGECFKGVFGNAKGTRKRNKKSSKSNKSRKSHKKSNKKSRRNNKKHTNKKHKK